MSFNMSMFLKVLRAKGSLSDKQINSVKEAYNIASTERKLEVRPGDVFRSTQGVRMVAKLKDGNYILVSLKSFRTYANNVGEAVAKPMTYEELVVYCLSHEYEKMATSPELADEIYPPGKMPPEVFDFEDFEAPPIKSRWRPGPRP